jgi:hypothetical protein
MKLFQYWDTGDPPDEISELIRRLKEQNSNFEHRLYDEETAGAFIASRQGTRHWAAFRSCAVPAMQADYFRLCALHACGGVYVDADMKSTRPLSELLHQFPGDFMASFEDFAMTSLMVFRHPGNLFLQAFLELATRNIEDHKFSSAMIATGPYVGDAIHALVDPTWHAAAFERQDAWGRAMRFGELLDRARSAIEVTPALVSSFRAITFIPMEEVSAWAGPVWAAYKNSSRHWTNWEGPAYRGVNTGS